MATLGRGALILALLLGIYAAIAAVLGARSRDRRLILSSRRAVYALVGGGADGRRGVHGRHRQPRLLVRDRRRDLVPQAADRVPGDLVLGVAAGLAAAVADRAGRASPASCCDQQALQPGADAMGDRDPGGHLRVLRVDAGVRRQPVRHADRAAPTAAASTRRCRTRTWSPTRRPSTWATSGSRSRSRSAWPRCSPGSATRAGSSPRAAGRSSSWAFLGVGMLLGAHWAYVEVGWGGFWAWDPVENAALMPWLTATAFLHSVMVQEKKGMLKAWNVALVSATFALSIFGTFLTRSGILSSIHAFVSSNVGYWFIGYIAAILVLSTTLLITRMDLLRSEHRMESLVSREATFLFNNLLFVGLAFAVLWGVTFPLISEAVTGEKITVNAPFFNFFVVAFGLPLILLMGVGPVIAWRRASLRACGATFGIPFAIGVGRRPRPDRARLRRPSRGHGGLLAVGVRGRRDRARVRAAARRPARRWPAARGRGVRVAREPQPAALRRLHRAPRRGHLRDRRDRRHGVLDRRTRRVLQPGQTMQVRNYTLRVRRRHAPHRRELRGALGRRPRRRRTASRWARSSPASARTRPRARPRTRSRSAPTGATARTCS